MTFAVPPWVPGSVSVSDPRPFAPMLYEPLLRATGVVGYTEPPVRLIFPLSFVSTTLGLAPVVTTDPPERGRRPTIANSPPPVSGPETPKASLPLIALVEKEAGF